MSPWPDLLKRIVELFVLHPEHLTLAVGHVQRVTTLQFSCHPGDVGRVIGERGAHFKALAALSRAYGRTNGQNIETLPVVRLPGGDSDRYERFKANPDWPAEAIRSLIEQVAKCCLSKSPTVIVDRRDRSGSITEFVVSVNHLEPKRQLDEIADAMGVIFNAVGKANGRTLIVVVAATIGASAEALAG